MEYILIYILISLILFLILREFFTWYWKLNHIINLLKEQNKLLKILIEHFEESKEEALENDTKEPEEVEIDFNAMETKSKKSLRDRLKEAEEELKTKHK